MQSCRMRTVCSIISQLGKDERKHFQIRQKIFLSIPRIFCFSLLTSNNPNMPVPDKEVQATWMQCPQPSSDSQSKLRGDNNRRCSRCFSTATIIVSVALIIVTLYFWNIKMWFQSRNEYTNSLNCSFSVAKSTLQSQMSLS